MSHIIHTEPTERLHSLDSVRGFALLLGVALHATLSYLPGAQYWWFVGDDASTVLATGFFWVHQFRMLAFFLIAGYFGRLLLTRLGVAAFIKDRLRRVLLPLLMAWPLVFTGIVLVVIWIALIKFGGSLPKESPPGPKFTSDDFPLTHLWFLYVLSLFYVAMLAVRGLLQVIDKKQQLNTLADHCMRSAMLPGAALLLAIPTALALYFHAKWTMWFGVPTPDQSLYPNLAALVSGGTGFVFGWLLQRQTALLQTLERFYGLHLLIALAATIYCLSRVGLTPSFDAAPQNLHTLAFAYSYCIGAWSWTFAIIAIAQRFFSTHSPLRRTIADASYWVYIVHLPIVMALQVAFSLVNWTWWLEYPLALGIGFALMFGSYVLFVRGRWIGKLLNGKRPAARAVQPQTMTLAATSSVSDIR